MLNDETRKPSGAVIGAGTVGALGIRGDEPLEAAQHVRVGGLQQEPRQGLAAVSVDVGACVLNDIVLKKFPHFNT